jgi:hypothetical protein
MSTNRRGVAGTATASLALCAGCLLLVLTCLGWTPARATTQAEASRAQAPMPHERMGAGGHTEKVHWTRMNGYLEGTQGHAAMLEEFKAEVQRCVQLTQEAGRPAKPPKLWPDYLTSTQQDTYASVNRTIRYATTISYAMNVIDCSLIEVKSSTATLTSTKGMCNIDLDNRKAQGFCDRLAHADAPVMLRSGAIASDSPELATKVRNPALLAALRMAIRLGPVKTGERKTIAGLECDVWNGVLGGGTACISRGGSFIASHAAPGLSGSSMELEMVNPVGMNMHAIRAQLDATVNSAVFAPYLAAGFEVTDFGANK